MRWRTALLLLAIHAAHGCDLCDGIERGDSHVVRLTMASADAVLAAHELALVGFYAPWCEVCKFFAPTYERVAEALRSEGVLVGKVHVADEPRLARRFGAVVQHAPVLVVVRRGIAIPYGGGRTFSELVETLRAHQRPAVLELGSDAGAVEQYWAAPPAHLPRVLVRSAQPASAMPAVDGAAGALRGAVAFARAPPAPGAGEAETGGAGGPQADAPPTVQLLRPWASGGPSDDEPRTVEYTGPLDARLLLAWAEWRAAPAVAELSASNAGTYLRRGHTAVLALGAELSGAQRAAFVSQLRSLARARTAGADGGSAPPIWWVHLSKADGVHARLLERLGFSARRPTQFALLNVSAPAAFEQHTLRAWLREPSALAAAAAPLVEAYSRGGSRPDLRLWGVDARDAAACAGLALCAALLGWAARRRARRRAGANAEQAVKMAKFFQGVTPCLISAYSRVARQPSPALNAGLLEGGAELNAAFHDTASEEVNEADKKVLSSALDFFHKRLNSEYGGESAVDDLDLDFVAEGRRLLAIQRFQVLSGADEAAAAACCLGEIARLVEEGSADAGSLVLLPGFEPDVALFADMFLREPLEWLGLENVSIDAMRPSGGAPVPLVRLFAGLSAVPEPVEVSVTRLSARQIVEGLDLDSP